MKHILITTTLTLLLTVTGCVSLTESEANALKQQAREDAKNAPESEHLAYLQCYALHPMKKRSCKRGFARSEPRSHSRLSEYTLPYDYEAERLGFVHFIRTHGKPCDGIDQGVLFDKEHNAYKATCTDNNSYFLHWDNDNQTWQMVEQ